MKKTILFLAIITCSSPLIAQNFSMVWGDEIKLKKGTADLDVVAADNTGLYFTEARMRPRSLFSIGNPYSANYKLYKIDKNFSEVFDKDYKKELKGLEFNSFQTLGNDLYMFASDYLKKEKLFKVYGAKVDKNSGELIGDFAELGSYQLESKKDDYEMKMTPIQNGKSFLLVSNISGKDRTTLAVSVLDKSFKEKESAIINLSEDQDHFTLEDVQYSNSDKIVLLGREYVETPSGKKKKRTVMTFKQYFMVVYNNKGAKEKEVPLETDNRFIISGKLIESPSGDLLLAGFYSNESKKSDLNGFFINKVDPLKGELLLSSFKEINSGMLGKNFTDDADDDDETKAQKKDAQKAKDDDDEDDFPNRFIIKSVDINPVDNSVIITSEVSQYSTYSYVNSTYDYATNRYRNTVTYVHRFTNQDILVINSDKDGQIKWMNDIPKSQLEEIRTSSSSSSYGFGGYMGGSDAYYRGNYFAKGGGMPYYSSYISVLNKNNLVLLLNDHINNTTNPGYGDKVKVLYNFRKKSNTYGIWIDLATGKMNRKFIASNNVDAVLMPRHGMVVGNEIFIPSWRQHVMAKTELKFAKFTMK